MSLSLRERESTVLF
uniref:Uncharacterized protein n=1 Tax=Anguilla anguilla TaxID=7936 RepID=A0A0E9PHX1_ANGAN